MCSVTILKAFFFFFCFIFFNLYVGVILVFNLSISAPAAHLRPPHFLSVPSARRPPFRRLPVSKFYFFFLFVIYCCLAEVCAFGCSKTVLCNAWQICGIWLAKKKKSSLWKLWDFGCLVVYVNCGNREVEHLNC